MKLNTALLALLALIPSSFAYGKDGKEKGKISSLKVQKDKCVGGACKISSASLDISADTIQFTVAADGPVYECEKVRGNDSQRQCQNGAVATILKMGTNGKGEEKIFASLVSPEENKICRIAPDANGDNTVICKDVNDFPDESEPMAGDEPDEYPVESEPWQAAEFKQGHRELQSTVIDVMVVWTARAECRNSGLLPGCPLTENTKANMDGLIALAIEETNTAYTASGVDAQLSLVHSYRDETYVETGFLSTLTELRRTDDGILDDVHAKRAQYGADVVGMIIDSSGSCGIGYLGPSKAYMFSATAWNCATGYYSFGHEIGHNMGCNHDRGTKNTCGGGNYNYGYRDTQARFRSILAYSCSSGQCDNNAGGGCTRVPMFSNPTNKYQGNSIGNAANDNARKINDVKQQIAAYYTTAVSPTTPPVVSPTTAPVVPPTVPPTTAPVVSPTVPPTTAPVVPPTTAPVVPPTTAPVVPPTTAPVVSPTAPPTTAPANAPSPNPNCNPGELEYKVDIITDGYPKETSWEIAKFGSTVVAEVNPGHYTDGNTEYTATGCIADDCYSFTMKDTYGDGACCSHGAGSYAIKFDGDVRGSGDQFMNSEIVLFGNCA